MSEPVTVEELREARNAFEYQWWPNSNDPAMPSMWCGEVIEQGRGFVDKRHHATLLRALDEAMVVLKDLAQSKGWLLGDTEKVSVALDNADTIIARYEEAKGD